MPPIVEQKSTFEFGGSLPRIEVLVDSDNPPRLTTPEFVQERLSAFLTESVVDRKTPIRCVLKGTHSKEIRELLSREEFDWERVLYYLGSAPWLGRAEPDGTIEVYLDDIVITELFCRALFDPRLDQLPSAEILRADISVRNDDLWVTGISDFVTKIMQHELDHAFLSPEELTAVERRVKSGQRIKKIVAVGFLGLEAVSLFFAQLGFQVSPQEVQRLIESGVFLSVLVLAHHVGREFLGIHPEYELEPAELRAREASKKSYGFMVLQPSVDELSEKHLHMIRMAIRKNGVSSLGHLRHWLLKFLGR